MKSKTILVTLLLVLAGVAVYTTTVVAQTTNAPVLRHRREIHPRIRHAIVALEDAKVELKTAAHDFGGHREDALKECDAAIAQLKVALANDKN